LDISLVNFKCMSKDYGAVVSQQGYDVKTCADRYLVYSSAFRSLKIFNVSSVSTTIPASGTNVITITHDLGYLAPCIVIYNGSTTSGVLKSYFMSDSQVSNLDIEISTTTIKINIPTGFDSPANNTGDTVYFTVYSFLETFDTYSASNINTGTTLGAESQDYGFRISKPGYDVKTCTDEQCVLSSSFFTHIVHKKGKNSTDGIVSHTLGYIPLFLGFIKYSGNSFLSYDPRFTWIDSSNVECFLNAGDEFYYIIFKSKQL